MRIFSQRNSSKTHKSSLNQAPQSFHNMNHQRELIQERENLKTGADLEPPVSSSAYSSILQIAPMMSDQSRVLLP